MRVCGTVCVTDMWWHDKKNKRLGYLDTQTLRIGERTDTKAGDRQNGIMRSRHRCAVETSFILVSLASCIITAAQLPAKE